MKDILRQKDSELLTAVHNAISGNIKNARANISYSPFERSSVLVLIPSNKDREKVNQLIRDGM